MNREIEFRVWDKDHKVMYDWNEISIEKDQVFSSDGDIYISYDRCVLMQWTGLKDKNNNKVFEGDILKSTVDGKLLAWKVMFKDGCFGIRNISSDGGENHAEFHAINSPYYFSDRVVINNIYEAPTIN